MVWMAPPESRRARRNPSTMTFRSRGRTVGCSMGLASVIVHPIDRSPPTLKHRSPHQPRTSRHACSLCRLPPECRARANKCSTLRFGLRSKRCFLTQGRPTSSMNSRQMFVRRAGRRPETDTLRGLSIPAGSGPTVLPSIGMGMHNLARSTHQQCLRGTGSTYSTNGMGLDAKKS